MEGKEKASTSLRNVETIVKDSIEEKQKIQESLKNINQQTNDTQENHDAGR
jgi:hypothetical protein